MDIVEPFQVQIGNRPASSVSSFLDPYNNYDYALGGIPFLSAVDENHPLTRSSAEFKRTQIDQSSEPGEQSLTGWWLRSQSSFHYGSGLKYEEPGVDETAQFRYNDSEGVDVWTEGQVTLLKATKLVKATGTTGTQKSVSGVWAGVNYYFRVDGNNVFRGIENGTETQIFTGSEAILDVTASGEYVYVSNTKEIWQLKMDASAPVKKWDFAATPGTSTVIGWNKERMMLGLDNKVYELSMSSSALPGTPLYTHPDAGWRWTDFDEGPVAIYASGYNGSSSKIFSFGLDTSGVLPTLKGGVVVAEMPTGEKVNVMYGYLGAFLGIGTTTGVRIASIAESGAIEYGPIIRTPNPVLSIWARDTSIYAGFTNGFSDGGSGLIRVNLETLLPNGRFAYATDLWTHVAGDVTSVCLFGNTGRLLISLNDNGLFLEESSILEPEGWLRTARIRYNMTWPKLFKQFSIDGTIDGSMSISAIDDAENETTLATVDIATDLRSDFQINYPDSPQHFLAMRFRLFRNASDSTRGPLFRSYQMKALPAGPRPRSFIVPFLCLDSEKTKDGVVTGYPGWCIERLEQVEALDSAGQVVLFEDLVNERSWLVTIEQIEFRQVVPPARNREEWGGILTVSMRTIV